MENNLPDIFEQARQLVAEADRRVAETERRRREIEGQAKLAELVIRAEEAFDFTSREKLELDPRMDVHEDTAVIEFVVRAARAIFVLAPKDYLLWDLLVVEDGKDVSKVAEITGGVKSEPNSRRLAAARVVASIATWVEKSRSSRRASQMQPQATISQPVAAPAPLSQPLAAPEQAGETLPAANNSDLPGFYEPRDRRSSDAARYEETQAKPSNQPPARTAPVRDNISPARANYGTFGKFFGH